MAMKVDQVDGTIRWGRYKTSSIVVQMRMREQMLRSIRMVCSLRVLDPAINNPVA
jgi:hypothetical protein